MTTPNLDEATKEALNGLSNRAQHIVAGIDVFNYGFNGLIHSVLLQRAREVVQGNIPLDEFVRTYELRDFSGSISLAEALERPGSKRGYRYLPGNFTGSLRKILEHNQIFVPKRRLNWFNQRDDFYFFDSDLGNGLGNIETGYDPAIYLTKRKWSPKDLANPKYVEDGIKMGNILWRRELEGRELEAKCYFKNFGEAEVKDLSEQRKQELREIGEKLIAYYSALISKPTTLK